MSLIDGHGYNSKFQAIVTFLSFWMAVGLGYHWISQTIKYLNVDELSCADVSGPLGLMYDIFTHPVYLNRGLNIMTDETHK